ncbi:MAG: hypothetical protein V1771_04865 [Chloroflexota bacterium]
MNIENLLVTDDIGRKLPLPAITGPVLGLLYFVAVPFLGFAALLYFIGQRTGQLAIAVWHRLIHPHNGEDKAGAHRHI